MVEVDKEVNQAVDRIAQAQMAADRLEKANKDFEEVIKKMESIATRQILGGKSSAGEPMVEKKEETPTEYAKRMLRGGI